MCPQSAARATTEILKCRYQAITRFDLQSGGFE
jgi:hypothetical protein